MNVCTANDLEAADLLALARLDDDGAAGGDPAAPMHNPNGSAPRPLSRPAPAALRGQPGSWPGP
jgi:hypothetical protein